MELSKVEDRTNEFEKYMIDNMELIEIPITHLFCNNMYVRTMECKAGTILTSKIHKTEHPFCLSKGRISVMTEDGQWKELKAPYNGITKKGNRRIIMVHEDCTWTTFHNYRGMKDRFNLLTEGEKDAIAEKLEKRIVTESINTKKLR
jgi:hypothetical protein